jgi:cell division protein ZipA
MQQLRWILLGAGLVLILGIYLWGLRARRRAAAPAPERVTRVEPARVVTVAPEHQHDEPAEPAYEPPADEPEPVPFDEPDEEVAEAAPRRVPGSVRREPRFEPLPEARIEPRVEPTIGGVRAEPAPDPQEPAITASREEPRPAPAATRKPPAQKIVALRIVAGGGGVFEGAQLLEALKADSFVFGRYQIFHRLDESGRAIVSLASLKEPGSFDPDNMPGMDFRGVALFAVVPGPLPGVRAFDELIVTARALATALGGQLQDERGAPLTLARIGQLREDVADFERARSAAPGA